MAAALAASVVIAAVVLASPAWAATYTVNTNADSGEGSLRQAIIDANTTTGVADTINFDPSLSGQTITLTSGQLPTIESQFDVAGLTIDGGSAEITISGANQYGVFEVDPGANLTLRNLTEKGGISNHGGTLTVSNSTISGIYNQSGTATVSNSTVSSKELGDFLGIYNLGALTVSNSTISGNSAGGINNNASGTLEVSNSTISSNGTSASFGAGGGIFNSGSTATVSNSTISGNGNSVSGSDGGGIYNHSTLTVSNSTISGNSAEEGGGILSDFGTVTVGNSTISDNSAAFGGGINNKVTFPAASATFKNTIVAANHASAVVPDVRGSFTSQGHNLIGQSDCSVEFCFTNEDLVGTTANPIDPMLGPLANNGGPTLTHALLEGSPAIDKGVAVEGITTDQRGFARPQGTAPDIGSFESEFTTTGDTIKPHVSTATPTGTGISRDTNLRATFSEQMDPTSITKSTFKLFRCPSATSTNCTTQITNGTLRKSTDGLSATINPYGTSATKLNAKTKYKAVITTGAKDMAGNALDQDQNPNNGNQPKQWTFTTGPKK